MNDTAGIQSFVLTATHNTMLRKAKLLAIVDLVGYQHDGIRVWDLGLMVLTCNLKSCPSEITVVSKARKNGFRVSLRMSTSLPQS